jgi:hypothetical protein
MFPDSSEMNDTSKPFEQDFLVQRALDSVEVNIADKATDANGHPSKDSDDRIDAENMDVDEPDMTHDGSKTNDANSEPTESRVDDYVEMNDVSVGYHTKKITLPVTPLTVPVRVSVLVL